MTVGFSFHIFYTLVDIIIFDLFAFSGPDLTPAI